MTKRTCSEPDCDRAHRARGWCGKHYEDWRRRGGVVQPQKSLEERLWSKVDKGDGAGCWLWTGHIARDGYAKLRLSSAESLYPYAHRVAYELLVGPIPEGLTLDHLCRVRHCVNPAHLEPVTMRENLRRGEGFAGTNARKTHCKHGHLLDEANTIQRHDGRVCRICHREQDRLQKQAKRRGGLK